MDFSARIESVNSNISDLVSLVKDGKVAKSEELRLALVQLKKDHAKMQEAKDSDITPEYYKNLNVRILKCEKDLAKFEMLFHSTREHVKGPESDLRAIELEREARKHEKMDGKVDWGKYHRLRGDDKHNRLFVEAMGMAPTDAKRARVAALRGLEVLEAGDPLLDVLRRDLQNTFDADPVSGYRYAVDRYSPERELTPAKFDFIRFVKEKNENYTPNSREDMYALDSEEEVRNFINWANENPAKAQYLLEDVAPLAIKHHLFKEYEGMVKEVAEKCSYGPFAPNHPLNDNEIKYVRMADTYRLLNEGTHAEYAPASDQLVDIHKDCQIMREKEYAVAAQGNPNNAKKIYDQIVSDERARIESQAPKEAEEGRKYSDSSFREWPSITYERLSELPWTKWAVSGFTAKGVLQKAARIALLGVCVAGVAVSVGGGVALLVAGSAAYGVGAIAGPLVISAGIAASGSLFAFGNMLLDRFSSNGKPKPMTEEQKEAELKKGLAKKLVKGWKDSGYLYSYPEVKQNKKDYKVDIDQYESELLARFEAKKEAYLKGQIDANKKPGPFEIAKAYREAVEECANQKQVYTVLSATEIRAFEIAVNRMTDGVVKQEINESLQR